MATCSKGKQKVLVANCVYAYHKNFYIEQKLEICQRLRGGASITALSRNHNLFDHMYKLNSRTNKSPISSDNQGPTVFSFLTTAKKTRECKVVNSEPAADT